MAGKLTVLLHGPRDAVARQVVDVGGGRSDLCVIVDCVDPALKQLKRDVLALVVDRIVRSRGSATARIKNAVEEADQLVRSRGPAPGVAPIGLPGSHSGGRGRSGAHANRPVDTDPSSARAPSPSGIGLGVVLVRRDEVIVATVGAIDALRSAEEDQLPDRPPVHSALGAGETAIIDWSLWSVPPGEWLAVVPRRVVSALSSPPGSPREVRPQLEGLASEPDQNVLAESLANAFGHDVPLVYVGRSSTPAADSSTGGLEDATPLPNRTPSSPGQHPGQAASGTSRPTAAGVLQRIDPGWARLRASRARLAALLRATALVTGGLLPERETAEDRRQDRARVAAAIAIALPMAVLALTFALLAMGGVPAMTNGTDSSPAGAGPAPAETEFSPAGSGAEPVSAATGEPTRTPTPTTPTPSAHRLPQSYAIVRGRAHAHQSIAPAGTANEPSEPEV